VTLGEISDWRRKQQTVKRLITVVTRAPSYAENPIALLLNAVCLTPRPMWQYRSEESLNHLFGTRWWWKIPRHDDLFSVMIRTRLENEQAVTLGKSRLSALAGKIKTNYSNTVYSHKLKESPQKNSSFHWEWTKSEGLSHLSLWGHTFGV